MSLSVVLVGNKPVLPSILNRLLPVQTKAFKARGQMGELVVLRRSSDPDFPFFFHLRYWLCKVLSLGWPVWLSGGVVLEGHGNIDVWRVNGMCESGGVSYQITNNPHWLIISNKSLTGEAIDPLCERGATETLEGQMRNAFAPFSSAQWAQECHLPSTCPARIELLHGGHPVSTGK